MSGKKRFGTRLRGQSGKLLTRRRLLESSGATAAAAAFAMALPRGVRAQDGDVLRLGVMGPMTGPASRTGQAILRGAEMALDEAREEGEVPVTIGGEQRDIEIVPVDSESNPERAVRAANDAIDRQGVQMLVAGWHSSVAMAMVDALAGLDIVHIGHGGESQFICEKINENPENYRHWFKGWSAPPIFAGLYGEPLKHFMDEGLWQPRNMRAAVMVEDTDFGRGWGEALVNQLTEAGFEVLPYDVTALDETEFSALLTRYKAQDVSLVGMTTTGSIGASNFVKQFRQQNVQALLLGHGLTWFPEWDELTGEAADFTVTMDSPRVIAPYQQEWIARYEERYGEEPALAPAGQSYDYMRLAIKVLNEADSLDFETLVQTTLDVDHQGVWHRYNFAEEVNERAMCPGEVMVGGFEEGFFFPMVQLMDGEAKIIWPLEHAEAEFQAPPWL
ncbi:MAG: ABC transporter substrate-binding protein [Hyphomicrobiales bacterium]